MSVLKCPFCKYQLTIDNNFIIIDGNFSLLRCEQSQCVNKYQALINFDIKIYEYFYFEGASVLNDIWRNELQISYLNNPKIILNRSFDKINKKTLNKIKTFLILA